MLILSLLLEDVFVQCRILSSLFSVNFDHFCREVRKFIVSPFRERYVFFVFNVLLGYGFCLIIKLFFWLWGNQYCAWCVCAVCAWVYMYVCRGLVFTEIFQCESLENPSHYIFIYYFPSFSFSCNSMPVTCTLDFYIMSHHLLFTFLYFPLKQNCWTFLLAFYIF